MSEKKFLRYIHYFRGLAILLIVGLHVAIAFNWGENPVDRRIALSLFNNGTVLFVFIAGYLFFHLNKDSFNYDDYLKKKFLYVILPYLIVSIPALLDKFLLDHTGDHWWMDERFAEKSVFVQAAFLLCTGRHMGVFWFIPMITILYIAAPLLLRFAKTSAFLYIAPLLAVAGLFTFRFGYYANIGLSLIYFVPVYLFGIWVYRVKDFLFAYARLFAWLCGGVVLIITVAEVTELIPFSDMLALRDAKVTVYKLNVNKLKMMVYSIGALLFFFLYTHKKIPFFQLLGDYSFGIFFVHLYVIQAFRMLDRSGLWKISPINFFSFLLYFLAIGGITVLTVALIKRIFKQNSRYIIGS